MLTGACWFSTLDLTSGYNQVPVIEKDKLLKTAFYTPFGLFEWNRLPFGLCNAPSTFQRLMERLFGDQQCQSLILYFLPLWSSTWNSWRLFWDDWSDRDLKAKLEKYVFLRSEARYLGHVISSEGVATDPSKIQAVAQWRCPSNATELRFFLGFASYYRRFVEGFAKIAAPLHRLAAEFSGGKGKRI